MDALLAAQLGLGADPGLVAARLTSLDLSRNHVSDLAGINHLVNLEVLDIR